MSSPIVPGWWDGEPTAESKEPALGWWAVTHGYGEYSGEGFSRSQNAFPTKRLNLGVTLSD